MPELTEQMYCHQQICIPPTFPYLLRQYAKAAIRSQPIDLLKWSTSYFRCLSLNIPPPVKPRLEYPIPRDYVGITPGWLRALNYQLQNNITVPFKILWDRWIGSCLQHETLIKILCLGGFTDPNAIPWNRFIGLCAGFLSDNLTQTMILVCEILTEEPEGGSAMITLETFLDVYKFLAAIDASKAQTLLNLYFTDSLLNLYEKERKKAARAASIEEAPTIESSTETPEEILEEQEAEIMLMGEGSIVSCPDIGSDDVLQEPDIEERERSEESTTDAQKDEDEVSEEDEDDVGAAKFPSLEEKDSKALPDDSVIEERKSEEEVMGGEGPAGDAAGDEGGEDAGSEEHGAEEQEETAVEEPTDRGDEDEERDEEEQREEQREENLQEENESKERLERPGDGEEEGDAQREGSDEDQLKQVARDILEKGGIVYDEEPQETENEEGDAEEDRFSEELETFQYMKEGASASQLESTGEGPYYEGMDELEEHIKIKYTDVGIGQEEVQEEVMEEEEGPQEIECEAVPGIGPIVPAELVEAVEHYLTKMAAEEHGMTMPRHVRHYNCPPLEVQEDL